MKETTYFSLYSTARLRACLGNFFTCCTCICISNYAFSRRDSHSGKMILQQFFCQYVCPSPLIFCLYVNYYWVSYIWSRCKIIDLLLPTFFHIPTHLKSTARASNAPWGHFGWRVAIKPFLA